MKQTANVVKPSRWLMQQKRYAKPWIELTVAIGFLNGLFVMVQSGLLAWIIDQAFLHHATRNTLMPLLWMILACVFSRAVLAWLKECCSFKGSAAIRRQLRQQLLVKLGTLGPVLSKQKRSGEWVSTVLDQVEALHGFFAYYLPQMSLVVLVPICIVILVFWLNWVAGVILLVTAPLIPLFMALVGMKAAALNQKNFQTLARMSAHFLDVLQGLTTLKLFGRSHDQAEQIKVVSDQYRHTTMHTLRIAFLSSGVLELFSTMAIALLATYLGLSLLGDIHLGQPVTLFSGLFILLLAPEFFMGLRELGTHYHARAQAVAAAEEMWSVLMLPALQTTQNLRLLPNHPLPLQLTQVGFCYPDRSVAAIHGLTLQIQAGEHVAIVGRSGSGKSTLLNLLLGFLSPTQGQIQAGGVALAEVDRNAWWQQLSWVSQQPTFFHGSLRDNMLLAKPDATEQALQSALQYAGIESFINTLPKGIDTRIAEQNMGLSGGQIQRLALARAYLKNAPLLLLDEPTASLDAATELQVLQQLFQWIEGKTLIMVTHRLEILSRMDRIIVLEAGRMVQQGSLAQLQQEPGVFQQYLQEITL